MCFISFFFHQLQKSSIDWKKGSRKADILSAEQSYEDKGIRQPEKGLSLLVQHILGKPLDKTEQLSNWEKRPLREEQIIYAGLVTDSVTRCYICPLDDMFVCCLSPEKLLSSKWRKMALWINSCSEKPAHGIFVLLQT